MNAQFAELLNIEGNCPITSASEPEFFRLLQTCLLILLRDQGFLNDIQLRYGLETLNSSEKYL